jgi:hypothetical protein
MGKWFVRTFLVTLGSGLLALGCRQQTTFINGNDVAVRKDPNAPTCNSVEQHGHSVALTSSRLSASPAIGGRIENGTYVLTSSILYTRERPHGSVLLNIGRTTMVIIGEIAQLIRTDADERERRTTVKRITNGSTTTLETVCSSGSQKQTESTSTSYTATANGFQFITPSPAGTVVATYTKVEGGGAAAAAAAAAANEPQDGMKDEKAAAPNP